MGSIGFLGALVFAVTGGITTFFAPCAFPLLPGYIGYFLQHDDDTHPAVPALAATASALSVLVLIGAGGFVLGRTLLERLPLFEPLVGLVLVVFGTLMFVDRAPDVRIALPKRSDSVLGFGLFGAGYAVAAAGCVVPILLGVLAQALAFPPIKAAAVFGAYALAVALPLVGVTLLAAAGTDTWRHAGKYTKQLQTIAAVTMVLAGIGQLYLSIVILDVISLS